VETKVINVIDGSIVHLKFIKIISNSGKNKFTDAVFNKWDDPELKQVMLTIEQDRKAIRGMFATVKMQIKWQNEEGITFTMKVGKSNNGYYEPNYETLATYIREKLALKTMDKIWGNTMTLDLSNYAFYDDDSAPVTHQPSLTEAELVEQIEGLKTALGFEEDEDERQKLKSQIQELEEKFNNNILNRK